MTTEMCRTGFRSVYLPQHIMVLVHGNNGSAADFDAMETSLLTKFGERQMLIIKARSNELDTSLGVDIGGARLAKEVVETVFEYDLCPIVTKYKLSVVGHSLGGLYARYALVSIMDALSCLHVEYIDFVTICTPHLGSRRARGPSTMKNILRLGVHKVLASQIFYGRTGIDLLLNVQEQQEGVTDADAAEPARPLLEVMSNPDSRFVRSLKRFQHGTLVAMTDGDVVVPYPSASMRNNSPYVSTFLTERYTDWRWHIHHSGFAEDAGICGTLPAYVAFLDRLNSKVDSSIEIEDIKLGLDASCTPRYPSIEGFDCDNKQEVEFPHEMLCSLQQMLPWRRIDVTVEPGGMMGKMRLHDWPISKMQPPDCRADEFIDLLCDMIGADHEMRPIATPDTDKKLHEHSALALARRLKKVANRIGDKLSSEQGSVDSDAETHESGVSSTASGDS
ncbi:hypothetical protein KXD40_004289 [Peronospora effusa]|uniref:DUF676 domain-containing protein n=1 Tax=Peronospora effusa TaxID=542832 RepID=A0A3M6VIJ4_9STRA|nr:hypothetical protein DD238_004131 [Peronospora effusa]UIZ28101.1 hypothetical protein KXD40_004289 [Peronospora effusa]